MKETSVFPPGTFTLSGVITEATSTGSLPVQDAGVIADGRLYQSMTDKLGAYEINGLYDGALVISVYKEGYQVEKRTVSMSGNTSFDIQVVRR